MPKVWRKIRERKNFGNVSKFTNIFFQYLTFTFSHELKTHFKGKIFECHCGSVFKSSKKLINHRKTHVEKRTCHVCQKQISPKGFAAHWKSFHLDTHGELEIIKKLQSFECHACSHKASSSATLKAHMLVCNKFSLNINNNLRKHVLVKCPTCSKICSKSNVSEHMQTHRRWKYHQWGFNYIFHLPTELVMQKNKQKFTIRVFFDPVYVDKKKSKINKMVLISFSNSIWQFSLQNNVQSLSTNGFFEL